MPPLSTTQRQPDLPTVKKTRRAVILLKTEKAAGKNGTKCSSCGQVVPFCGCTLSCVLFESWGSSRPTGNGSIVVPICKRKGDDQECNYHRGVTLLSVPSKVLARILLDRIGQMVLTHQHHVQSDFTPKKPTVDRILALRVSERLSDFRTRLLEAYVDLRKAFDSVNRYALWKILAFHGITTKPSI